MSLIFLGLPAWADPPAKDATLNVTAKGAKFSRPYGSHLEPILLKIQANPEQRQRITLIVESYRPKIEPLRVEYRQKSQQFLNAIMNGLPAEQIMASQGDLNKLYSVIVSQYSLMRLEIRKQLTPNQCKQFEEYRQKQGWSQN